MTQSPLSLLRWGFECFLPVCLLGQSRTQICATPLKEHNEVVQLERLLGGAGTQQALISPLTQLLPALL